MFLKNLLVDIFHRNNHIEPNVYLFIFYLFLYVSIKCIKSARKLILYKPKKK